MNLKRICICLLVFATVTVPVLAAGNSNVRVSSNAVITAQATQDEGADYKAWYDANDAKDYAKAYDLAKAFIAKYPNSANVTYLKGWIPSVRGTLFNAALNAKDVKKMLDLGNEALAEDPNNIDYLYLLSVAIYSYEIAQKNNEHASQLVDFNKRIISLLDSGKVPAAFATDKTFNKNNLSASLYQQIGVVELNNNQKDKALEVFQKAASLNPKDAYNYLQIGTLIYATKYIPASEKYGAFSTEDKGSDKPEVKAALDEVNKQADVVIDNWAHYVALEASPAASIKSGLDTLYKFRHSDSTEGLQKLIDQYKSGNGPVNPKP